MTRSAAAEQNRGVIRSLYDALNRGDSAAMAALIDDECVLTQSPGHPVAGVWAGRDAMTEGMGKVFAALHNTGATVHEIVADGPSRVIGLVDALGIDANGDPYATPVAECFEVHDGKVCDIRPFYWDQIRLREIARASST
jgi:ketosteroid isomerase-like protein